ncbi:MAG: CRISPR-associated endonuclease Cas3'', partial [Sphingobacteriia bacterium]|nr:CRISPR-associated endonuclease Cas3'' [Sphingobacteriia bacterium]
MPAATIIRALPSNCAFGKLERSQDGTISAWHPLIDHLIDVAACFHRLCCCRSIRRSMEKASGRALGSKDLARLTVLVFLHDLGKANCGFQAKRWLQGAIPKGWPNYAGHGIEATKLFSDDDFLQALVALLPIDALCTWGEAVELLLKASISHHGRPIIESAGDWSRAIWKPVMGRDGQTLYDPAPVLAEIGRRAVELYPDAFAPGGDPLPDAPAFGHLFAGLVQLADWLGSDTAFFPFSAARENRAKEAVGYAERAVMSLGLDADTSRAALTTHPPSFDQIFGNPPYPIQVAMKATDLGSLVILESETGSGKTEAALWRFVDLFERNQVDSLYFALPTRVSASQVYERILQAVGRLWPTNPPVGVDPTVVSPAAISPTENLRAKVSVRNTLPTVSF